MRLSHFLAGSVAALTLLAGTGSAALADTYALVTINSQALLFNQINDGAKAAAEAAGTELVILCTAVTNQANGAPS